MVRAVLRGLRGCRSRERACRKSGTFGRNSDTVSHQKNRFCLVTIRAISQAGSSRPRGETLGARAIRLCHRSGTFPRIPVSFARKLDRCRFGSVTFGLSHTGIVSSIALRILPRRVVLHPSS